MLEKGGGGVRILIDPADLRRGSKRLKQVGVGWGLVAKRLRGAPLPEMPPGIAARVSEALAELSSMFTSDAVPVLEESSIELDRRALWTEIADQLVAGLPLEGVLLDRFMEGLRNGTLVKYAEPWQAELAGRYIGETYGPDYKDPEKLIELAALLQANDGYDASGAFMAGFVEGFGAERIADIPRVIQAMDWTPGMADTGSYSDPFVDWDLGRKLWEEGYQLDGDAVELLSAFSMALALGTMSGRVAPEVEREIAQDEDSWAVAQLLYEGQFGANFLKEVFQSVVVRDIMRDAARFGSDLTAYMPIGGGDGEGPTVATDERMLVLDALMRNPEGLSLALTTPLPEEVYIASMWAPVETRDPFAVLYAADWEDDGEYLARMYSTASDYLQAQAGEPGTSTAGNRLTLSVIDRIIDANRSDLGVVTDALVNDISQNHVQGLIEAAGSAGTETDGDDIAGFLDLSSNRIYLSASEMQSLFVEIGERPAASQALMEAIGQQEAAYLVENVGADPKGAYDVGYQIGSLNQIILNANDLEKQIEFDRMSTQQKIAFSVFSEAIGLLTAPVPEAGLVTGPVIELASGSIGPSESDLAQAKFTDKLDTVGAVRALVAAAYVNADAVPAPTESYLLSDGHIAEYGKLNGPARAEFDQWVNGATRESVGLRWALSGASDGMTGHAP